MHRYLPVLLALLLLATGCSGEEEQSFLPVPVARATATATLTPTPTITATPAPPTLTPTPTVTPTPTLTPTPALPEMHLYSDEHEIVTVRVPRAWEVEEESNDSGLQIAFRHPDSSSAIFVVVSPAEAEDEKALERFIRTFWQDKAGYEQEERPDGTIRVTGETESGGQIEMRAQRRTNLVGALIIATDPQFRDEHRRIFEVAFDSLRLYPGAASRYFGTEVPDDAPLSLEVLSTAHYYTSPDTLWVIGEVVNRGMADVESVTVNADLLSLDGRVVAEAEGYLELEMLPAGKRAPFQILFEQAPEGNQWVAVQATAEAEPAAYYLEHLHRGLVVTEASPVEPSATGAYRIEGGIKNEGQGAAEFIRVIGALYNGAGEIIATNMTYATADRLRPGEEIPFELRFPDLAADRDAIADFRLWVTGNRGE